VKREKKKKNTSIKAETREDGIPSRKRKKYLETRKGSECGRSRK